MLYKARGVCVCVCVCVRERVLDNGDTANSEATL